MNTEYATTALGNLKPSIGKHFLAPFLNDFRTSTTPPVQGLNDKVSLPPPYSREPEIGLLRQ